MKNKTVLIAACASAFLCFLGAAGGNVSAASFLPASSSDAAPTAAAFKAAAREKLQHANIRLSDEAVAAFESMLAAAADKLSGGSDEERNQVPTSLDKLVRALVEEQAKKGKSSDELSGEDFVRARAGICPAWPFC